LKHFKNIIKFFIKKIHSNYLDLRDLYVYSRNNSKKINYSGISKKNSIALIFGNGPSLNDILNQSVKLDNADIFVCNGFALTSSYEILQPENYVLLDPAYFDFNNKYVKEKVNNVIETWDAIISKTTWKINLYTSVMDDASIKFIKSKITSNITWINILPLSFKGNHKYKFLLNGLGILGGQTVTHFSLQIALLKRYEEVFLCGVDLDWVENIKYDYSNNNVYLLNKHFFDETKLYFGEIGLYKDNNLADEFNSYYKTLKYFKELYELSIFLNVKLFRGTKSFIHFIPFKLYKFNSI
jgi:hypothetical protein